MTPEEKAFRAALAANPADATTRLVYADWLQENARPVDAALQRVLADPESDGRRLEYADAVGGERGEFVRVQCELARLEASPLRYDRDSDYHGSGCARRAGGKCRAFSLKGNCRRCEYIAGVSERNRRLKALRRRERELWSAHETLRGKSGVPPWSVVQFNEETRSGRLVPCPYTILLDGDPYPYPTEFPGNRIFTGHVRRGFVEEVTCTAADWLAHGDEIREQQPVRKVRLTTWPVCRSYSTKLEIEVRRDERREYPILNRKGESFEEAVAHAAQRAMEAAWGGIEFTLLPQGGFLVPEEFAPFLAVPPPGIVINTYS